MAKYRKQAAAVDIVAGIIVLIVALGLLVAVLFALRQCTGRLPVPTVPPTTTTMPPTTVPEPTLAPNPFDSQDFAYTAEGYLTCLAAESRLGIDVSEHQGSIDWPQVAASPVKFAMVRLGYRGWGKEGILREDARGLCNLDGAAGAGLDVGVYFFSQAISVEEAIEEARFLLDILDGRQLQMPIVFDWETVSAEDARTANMKRSTLTACALAFCREIEAAGYDAMVYFNLDLAKNKLDLLMLQQAGYDFWLALYSDGLGYRNRVQLWQYTSDGQVPGIKGRVDLNLYFP